MATIVRKGPGDSEDKLIAEFRKKVQADQILTELKEHEFYKKPSEIRKEKMSLLRRSKRKERR